MSSCAIVFCCNENSLTSSLPLLLHEAVINDQIYKIVRKGKGERSKEAKKQRTGHHHHHLFAAAASTEATRTTNDDDDDDET